MDSCSHMNSAGLWEDPLFNDWPEAVYPAPPASHWFLGGADLEMAAIARLLAPAVTATPTARLWDRSLRWGANIRDYADCLAALPPDTGAVVLIELTGAEDWAANQSIHLPITVIDHHGPRAGAHCPTAIEQVWALLGHPSATLPRSLRLIAANDRGYLPELLACGATVTERQAIRQADRRAQGLTAADDAVARACLAGARQDANGWLSVITVPESRLSSAVSDFAHPLLQGDILPDYPSALLTVGPQTISFSGDGRAVLALADTFPGGWYGGALPDSGYWGAPTTPGLAEATEALLRTLQPRP